MSQFGQTYTDLASFDGIHGAYPEYPNILAQGRDGSFYGTTMGGGIYSDGVVFKITPSGAVDVYTISRIALVIPLRGVD